MKIRFLQSLLLISVILSSCNNEEKRPFVKENGVKYYLADEPLYYDPVFNGPTDPVLCYNQQDGKWYMYYTSRRANMEGGGGTVWIHGTRIGVATSSDNGASWQYLDTCNISYRPDAEYTHWAPEVIEYEGTYHMYLTYVPGIFTDWEHPRDIVHLTSKDGMNWDFQSVPQLAVRKVIDACVFQLKDGSWRMWYNNEVDNKSIYYADSPDLFNWTDKGKANLETVGEGPKVIFWKDRYWMVVDEWKGLSVYSSDDAENWRKQEQYLVSGSGQGKDDRGHGHHADVVVAGDKAYLFYFSSQDENRRGIAIHAEELIYNEDGSVTCDREAPVYINLGKR